MKLIVHDLCEELWQGLNIHVKEHDRVICERENRDIGDFIGECRQLVLISRCVYGGFSPFIQSVLERCRARFEPLLEIRYGRTRYRMNPISKNLFGMVCCFYGDDITAEEEESARLLCVSNGILLQAAGVQVLFCDRPEKVNAINGILI